MAKNYRASLRKSGASGKKKAPTVFPSARTPALRHNEGAPLSTSPQPCNSTALAPRTFVPVHDLPSQSFRSNGGCCPTALQPFRSFPCAHSAVRGGFCPVFLLGCALTENPPLQHAATRRHRTQTYAILPNYGRILSQSIVLCERIRKPSVHAGLRVLFCEMTVS